MNGMCRAGAKSLTGIRAEANLPILMDRILLGHVDEQSMARTDQCCPTHGTGVFRVLESQGRNLQARPEKELG